MRTIRILTPLFVVAILLITALGVSASGPIDDGRSADTPVVTSPHAGNGPLDWQQDPVPSGFAFTRFDGEWFPASQKVYFLGGRLADNSTDGSIWWFDPATDTYGQPAGNPTMPQPISNYTIALLQDNTGWGMYLFGGRLGDGTQTTAVQVYYPATNTTSVIATDPYPGTCDSTPVGPGGVEVVGNKAYVFGGFNGTCMSAQTWVYDPMAADGARWTAGPALSTARSYIITAKVDGKIYAAGGDEWDGAALLVQPYLQRLDPANLGAGWVSLADMPVASSGIPGCDESRGFGFNTTSAVHLKGMILVAGCGQWGAELPDGFVYDVATNTWTAAYPLNQARRNHAGALVTIQASPHPEARAYVFGGRQGSDSNILQITEYKDLASSPTSVNLSQFSSGSQSTDWTPVIAGLGALALLGGLGLRRRAMKLG